jgi:hypothetical protein
LTPALRPEITLAVAIAVMPQMVRFCTVVTRSSLISSSTHPRYC